MKVVLKYLRLTMYLKNEEIGETAMVGEYVIDRTLAIPLCDFKILCHLVSFHFRSTRFLKTVYIDTRNTLK